MKSFEKKIGVFEILAKEGRARAGVFHTAHGAFQTPAFMPVGTQGTVKGVDPQRLEELGAEIVLANTYHLHLRPGDELIRDLGGLHKFMAWDGPILTDSGGFQVFSLAKLRTVTESGVTFQSHIDGSSVEFTPEKVVRIQENLGVDIMMVLDECLPYPCDKVQAAESLVRTLNWARAAKAAKVKKECLIFGIVQGGVYPDLRVQAAEGLKEIGFDGYAIGGVSVGEPTEAMREITDYSTRSLPEERVRYLMGVGTPTDIVCSVALGVDMFDCVMPTRSARFGRLFTSNREGESYINIRNTEFRTDSAPIDADCDCYTCRNFSRAYISHLIHSKEVLAVELASLHNLRFYQRLMSDIRTALCAGRFAVFMEEFLAKHRENKEA